MRPFGTISSVERSGAPRPQQVKRHELGQATFGKATRAAERLLATQGQLQEASNVPLAEQVRDYIYHRRNRERYVAAATDYLKKKRPRLSNDYDVIVVGAGIHAAMFVYTAAKKTKPNLKILIVEKSAAICSTFSRLGDSLVLNSPTFTKVGLNSNVAQGHFVQLSDFDELAERPFPTAKHLHELATMVFFHADADILFDFRVDRVRKAGCRYSISSDGRTVESKSVVVANGMGEQKNDSFVRDKRSESVIDGDSFTCACYEDEAFVERIRGKRIAVVGSGDTANCVMEALLPLTYPNEHYSASTKGPFVPSFVYWIGQSATSVQEFYFANKQRYCHSGGLIEFFWDGEAPFDLPTEAWSRTKALIRCVPDRLVALSHKASSIELMAGSERLGVDIVVDCTGRFNALSSVLLRDDYEFIEGDVVFCGGQWDEGLERFVVSPLLVEGRRIACKVKNERIFLLGCACPLDELIDDEEALDGSLRYQEDRKSLTNSKFSLEHTLPRSVAFAAQYADLIRE
ncbi:MAG: FAD-dependent oxidoreductase [Myxococcota bacterium]